ncbi:oligosaccharide flippase family protein [Pantoea alhagi]|uniref:oligosaccharide flippase family protein n=1 Tax=Pantoea alhagi TaxID=1891675 RepID=UPI00202B86F8|nr:oligosaccharide flippase family protein [Pantoea alhagi]URQ59613.1 oligosaccharide flippase family protein [Pantoea alhagi]
MNSIVEKIERVNNVIVGLSSNIIGNLILFLTTIYITNNVSEDVYGQFRLVFAFVSILVIVLMMGRDSSILYYYQKEKSDRVVIEEAVSGAFLVLLGCVLLYLMDDFFITNLLSDKVTLENYHLSLLMLPLWSLYNLLTPVVRVKGLINCSFILSNLLQRLLRFPFLLLFLYAGYNNFSGLAWSMILSQALLLLLLLFYLVRTLQWHPPLLSSFFTRFNYSFSLGINAIMLTIAGKIDVLLLGKLSTTTNVAIYDIVTSLAIVALFPYIALTKSFEPKLYGFFDNEQIKNSYKNNISISFTLTLVGGVFFILFGHEILYLFGDSYTEGMSSFILLVVFYSMLSCWGGVSEWMTMNGYAKHNFLFLIFCGALNVILCFLFIPKWGILGATVSLGLSLITSKFLAFVFISLKHSASNLLVNLKQILLLVTVLILAIYLNEQIFLVKSVIFMMMMLLIILSETFFRKKITALINRGIK